MTGQGALPAGPAAAEIARRIRSSGPIPFAEFMRLALYQPESGFYTTRAPGAGAGFETAPTTSPAFGRCIARLLHAMWRELGEPADFAVAELGPGTGALAASVLDSVPAAMAPSLRWIAVEPRQRIATLQRNALAGHPVTWVESLEHLEPICGCVLANEVFDALPVHVLRAGAGGIAVEAHVTLRGDDTFAFIDADPTPQASTALPDLRQIPDGHVFEVCPDASALIGLVRRALRRGYALVVDYGDTEPALFRDRPEGTVLAYGPAGPSDNVLDRPGALDLTAHVNFTALIRAAREAGLPLIAQTTQRELLLSYGLYDELEALKREAWAASGIESLRLHAQRSDAALLTSPAGMGAFLVALFGVDAGPVTGWPAPSPIDIAHDEVEASQDRDDVGDQDPFHQVWDDADVGE